MSTKMVTDNEWELNTLADVRDWLCVHRDSVLDPGSQITQAVKIIEGAIAYIESTQSQPLPLTWEGDGC